MKSKRYTPRKHICPQCSGEFARKWVLKRHLLSLHQQHFLESEDPPFTGTKANSPKLTASGLSGYICPFCLSAASPLPIKDLGHDLTSEARHQCKETAQEVRPEIIKPIKKGLVKRSGNLLVSHIDGWTDNRKKIYAQRITNIPHSVDSIEYLTTKFSIPSKCYITAVLLPKNTPWLARLLQEGSIEPSRNEMIEFCQLCTGTYAIVPIKYASNIEYYWMVLSPRRPPSY